MLNGYLTLIHTLLLLLTHTGVFYSVYGPPFASQPRYETLLGRMVTLSVRLTTYSVLVTVIFTIISGQE